MRGSLAEARALALILGLPETVSAIRWARQTETNCVSKKITLREASAIFLFLYRGRTRSDFRPFRSLLHRAVHRAQNGVSDPGTRSFRLPRNFTAKQSEFASRVAAGQTLVGAYREVYKPVDGKAASVYANAKRARRHPGIAARIKELQVELMPAPQDMRQIYEHGMAVVLQLSVASPDHRVRLRAAQWLCAEAEKREKLTPETVPRAPAEPMPTEAVIANLRELYRKAGMSPLAQEPLVVEVAEDKTPEAGSAADRESAEEGLPPAEQESAPMSYHLPIPGQFPQKFRQIQTPRAITRKS